MTVRSGHAGDFATILPMFYAFHALQEQRDPALYALRPDADARLRRWMGPVVEDPRSILVVAEDDGAIVGFLTAIVEHDLPIYQCDQYAVVFALWVQPPYRRRGIATAMLDHAAREYASLGIPQLRIRTASTDTQTLSALQHAHFRPTTLELVRELTLRPKPKRS